MRKIEENMIRAIQAGRNWASGNTTVSVRPVIAGEEIELLLHGNLIARRYFRGEDRPGRWEISLAGWNTVTTRSRLSALIRDISNNGGNGLGVSTKNGTVRLHDARGMTEIDADGWFVVTTA